MLTGEKKKELVFCCAKHLNEPVPTATYRTTSLLTFRCRDSRLFVPFGCRSSPEGRGMRRHKTNNVEDKNTFNQYFTNGSKESHNRRLRRFHRRHSKPSVRLTSLFRYHSSCEKSLNHDISPYKIKKKNATIPSRT